MPEQRRAPWTAAGAVFGLVLTVVAPAAAAGCLPPRLFAEQPDPPADRRPWVPGCLGGSAWQSQPCADWELEGYRRARDSYLADLDRFVARAEAFAEAAAGFARAARGYADCEAHALAR